MYGMGKSARMIFFEHTSLWGNEDMEQTKWKKMWQQSLFFT